MKILLVGAGAQGKAALFDFVKNKDIKQIVVFETNSKNVMDFVDGLEDERIEVVEGDANDRELMLQYFRQADVVLDLLPTPFRKYMTELAIETGTNIVNTSYRSHIKDCADAAARKGIIVVPEAGLDPGIDLILAGNAVKRFDDVESFFSATGGVPELEDCNNPINYKITWTFAGVLASYKRPANIIKDGEVVRIPGDKIFDFGEEVYVEGVGKMDRYPNGFSTTYAKLLGIRDTVKDMGRYVLRWPGHLSFWKKIGELGLLEEEPVNGIPPREYLAKVMEPRLQYEKKEKDMVVMKNEMVGTKDGRPKRVLQSLIDFRNMKTGMFAMNRTVGYTASIITQMVLSGKIKGKGVLNLAKDIPYKEFISELKKRGIMIHEKEEWLDVI